MSGRAPDGSAPGGEAAGTRRETSSPEAAGAGTLVGRRVGSYLVEALIGTGSMGTVYRGVQPDIGKRVAIKFLAPELNAIPEVVTRFFHEAKAVNLIGHEHIIDIFDFGRTADGQNYFVMELLDGPALDELLHHEGPLPVARAVGIGLQIAGALAAAHARGVIHRDLKPENVVLLQRSNRRDFVKVLDFGVAKLEPVLRSAHAAEHHTRDGAVIGTPGYMAPEQAAGEAVDERADVYALGVLLHHLVTGAAPFEARNHTDALLRQLTETPPRLDAARADVPAELADLVARLLSHAPADRPQKMAEVGAALRRVLEALAGESATAALLLEALPDEDEGDGAGPLGRSVTGSYELLAHLATGGMAEIHLARIRGAEGFEKLVVLKRVRRDLEGNAHVVQQFLDEARLSASLQHPNIVQVHDFGVLDGDYFLAMEFVHGQDLGSVMEASRRKARRLSLDEALTVVIGVCAGLHYAHEAVGPGGQALAIVHRDVSPSNVLLGYEGAVKVTDFGIAKSEAHDEGSGGGSWKGKFGYMSPEQCLMQPLDRRSDIFAISTLLYELTTGVVLFQGATAFETMKRVLEAPLPPPSSHLPDYPKELERIVLRGLSRDREARFATAQDMEEELEAFAREARLAVSPLTLVRMFDELFGDKVRAWKEAQRAGVPLAVHLSPPTTRPGSTGSGSWPRRRKGSQGSPAGRSGPGTGPGQRRNGSLPGQPAAGEGAEASGGAETAAPRRTPWLGLGGAALGLLGIGFAVAAVVLRNDAPPRPGTVAPAPQQAPAATVVAPAAPTVIAPPVVSPPTLVVPAPTAAANAAGAPDLGGAAVAPTATSTPSHPSPATSPSHRTGTRAAAPRKGPAFDPHGLLPSDTDSMLPPSQ